MELARRYLGAPRRGLEIGASAIAPFPGVAAWNLDYPGVGLFQAAQERIAGHAVPVDVYGLGDRLPFGDAALDFVLTSHVLEHMPDTIRCLREWSRVVRDGGIVFLVVPHKERTFDAHRPRTELAHHLADYALEASIENSPMVPTSHYHVWVTEDLVNLIEYLNEVGYLDWVVEEVEDVDSRAGNGFTIVARKRSQTRLPERESSDVAFWYLRLALPFQGAMRTTEFVVDGAELVTPTGLPRGPYDAMPITGGFPPSAGGARPIVVGEPIEAPTLWSNALVAPGRLRFEGDALCETTWLEADFGDGEPRRALPEYVEGGLEIDVTGLLPDHPITARAVNLPPGGGAGAPIEVRAHLG